jgi:hypothetical protein
MLMLMLCFGVLSCGDACEDPPTPAEQADELLTYIKDFERLYGVTVDYDVLLVDEELGNRPGILGICTWGGGEPPLVRIERTFWVENTDARRRALVFHELGHCSFFLPHNDRLFPVTILTNRGEFEVVDGPYSLMHSEIFSDRYYTQPFFSRHYEPQLWEEIEAQRENPATERGEISCTGHEEP